MSDAPKKIFDLNKGGNNDIKDESRGGHRHLPPIVPELDFKKEATPIHDSIETVDTAGPAVEPTQPVVHKLKPMPEGWGKGAHDLHKGGVNVFVKAGKK